MSHAKALRSQTRSIGHEVTRAIEGVLLTGGRSSRMGSDKSALIVKGEALAVRVARSLKEVCDPVTVLGRHPIEDNKFMQDEGDYEGPLAAISRFVPAKQLVFLAACDMPLFESNVVTELNERLEGCEACIPIIDGHRQPLCGIYRAEVFAKAQELAHKGERRLMVWLDCLDAKTIDAAELHNAAAIRSVNTWADLAILLAGRSA